ncbi:MAG: DUF58 domain-containing protein [bacterium]|nr:DUF58 domain-containing protein [bacterium]
MIPRELVRKIRRIQIYTNRVVNDVLAGSYHSVFKGRGMEFEEVREYQPGDDVKSIDWNVTARSGKPHIKRYREERELTVMLMVDVSASGRFGTADQLKSEVAAELSALLAFSAIKNNDKVGLIMFTDRVEKFVPPGQGIEHVLRVIRDLLSFKPTRKTTNIEGALSFLGRITTKRCVVFLVSDFLGMGYERSLKVINRRHDIIAVTIIDPVETEIMDLGFILIEDAETGECRLIDTGSESFRKGYKARSLGRRRELTRMLQSASVDQIEVLTDRSFVHPLVRFFRRREHRM